MHRRAALLGLLALGGCGFAPVYETGSNLRGRIAYRTPDTISGFRMRRRFEDRLGQPVSPQFVLDVTMDQKSSPTATNSDRDTTRVRITGTAEWQLTDAGGGVIGSGDMRSFVGYSTTGSTVATQTAARDAADRLAEALADLIVSRITLLDVSA